MATQGEQIQKMAEEIEALAVRYNLSKRKLSKSDIEEIEAEANELTAKPNKPA